MKDMISFRRFFMFLWKERAWWAAPFVIALLIIAVLVVLAQSPPVAPFLYTTF